MRQYALDHHGVLARRQRGHPPPKTVDTRGHPLRTPRASRRPRRDTSGERGEASAIEKSPLLPSRFPGAGRKPPLANQGPQKERATGVEPATSSLGSFLGPCGASFSAAVAEMG